MGRKLLQFFLTFIGLAFVVIIILEVYKYNYVQKGTEQLEQGNYQEAIKYYDKAIKVNPSNTEALYNRALAMQSLGSYIEATEGFNNVIEIDPDYALAYGNRAISRAKINDYKGALEDFNKLIEIEPNNADAYYNRGLVYYNYNSDNSNVSKHRKMLNDFLRRMNLNNALKDFNKAVEINPRYEKAYLSMTSVNRELFRRKEIVKNYTNAININPNNNRSYFNRAIAKINLFDFRGAIQDFTKVIEIKPDDGDAYYRRGILKLMIGNKDTGCLDLSRAGELGFTKAYDSINTSCIR